MKIGLITHMPLWPFSGGSSFRVYKYVKEMCKKHQVYAIAPADESVSIENVKKQFGKNFHFYPFKKFRVSRFVKEKELRYIGFALLSANKIREIHKKNKLDLVVCHNSICAPPAFILKKFYNVPYVLDIVDIVTGYSEANSENKIRNFFFKMLFKLVFFKIEKMFAREAIKTIAITDELGKSLDIKKYSVVHDGIDLKRFDFKKKDKKLREKFRGRKVVVFTSILDPVQNPEIIVYAAEHVVKKIPNILFLIIGKGSSVLFLKKIINEKNLEKNVVLTGWVNHEDLPSYISVSDLGLVTHPNNLSSRVMFPIKLLEYWAMKKPAIVSDLPQLRKVVKKSKSGILFNPGNCEDLANKICLAFKSDMKKMGERGRKLVEKEYDWDKVSVQFVKEIERV